MLIKYISLTKSLDANKKRKAYQAKDLILNKCDFSFDVYFTTKVNTKRLSTKANLRLFALWGWNWKRYLWFCAHWGYLITCRPSATRWSKAAPFVTASAFWKGANTPQNNSHTLSVLVFCCRRGYDDGRLYGNRNRNAAV